MSSAESEYIKCAEIFVANGRDYTFLCYYCNELFNEFIEFRNHNLSHLHENKPALTEIQTEEENSKLENFSELSEDFICNENEYINFHQNDYADNNIEDLDNDNMQTEKKYFDSINVESDLIDNIDDNKQENADKQQQNSEDLYCLHCKILFKNEFHDVERCSEIQKKIIQYNGNFLELLRHGILSCKCCRRYFKNHISLYEHHLKEGHCTQSKTCQICKFYSFMNKKIYSSDETIHLKKTKNEDKINDKLEKHRHKNTIFRYKCPECNLFFQKYAEKQKHVKIHAIDRYFSCYYEGCDAKFKFKSFLNLHEKTHLPNNFQCEMCGQYYKSQVYLLKHQQSAHTDSKTWPYQCEICDRRFSQSHRLVEHKRIHTGEKPFDCDICSKFFRKKSNLREHQKLHSEERKYVCRLCGKGFKQAPGYWGHMKRHTIIS